MLVTVSKERMVKEILSKTSPKVRVPRSSVVSNSTGYWRHDGPGSQ